MVINGEEFNQREMREKMSNEEMLKHSILEFLRQNPNSAYELSDIVIALKPEYGTKLEFVKLKDIGSILCAGIAIYHVLNLLEKEGKIKNADMYYMIV